MRLFFAAFPGDALRHKIHAAAASLPCESKSKIVLPENYHMTLVFLGEIDDRMVDAIRQIGEAQRVRRISLRFDRWEYWSSARAIVASASHRPEPLLHWRAALAADLGRMGATFDDKPLYPHITVARKIAQAHVLPALSEFEWPVSEFSLVASRTAATASVYTVIDTWPLLDIDATD